MDNSEKLLRRGIIFIVLIWYISICFCGVYENSASCLIINTLISILFTSIFTLAMFIFSSIFRFIGIKSKVESLPQTSVKEDLGIIYKSSTFTDGEDKGKKLDLHMNIMYHPDSKEPTKIILLIPGGAL